MSIIFRDISGRTISIQLGKESRVFNACQLLSKKLQISADKIFLLSPKEEINYYSNNEMIEHVKEENPEYVVFTSLYQNEKTNNKADQTELGLKDKSYLTNSIPFKTFVNFIDLKYNSKINTAHYTKYTRYINEIPSDLQQKIEEISILGYEIEDIKEALRTTHYNVLFAINLLAQRNSINLEANKVNNNPINDNSNQHIIHNLNNNLNTNNKSNFRFNLNDNHNITSNFSNNKLPSFEFIKNKKNAKIQYTSINNNYNNLWNRKPSVWCLNNTMANQNSFVKSSNNNQYMKSSSNKNLNNDINNTTATTTNCNYK